MATASGVPLDDDVQRVVSDFSDRLFRDDRLVGTIVSETRALE